MSNAGAANTRLLVPSRPEPFVFGKRVQNLRIPLRPCIVDHNGSKTPVPAVAQQFAGVSIHQQREICVWPASLARHEMLGHHIATQGRGIPLDMNLQIARGMTGIERPDQGQHTLKNLLATVKQRKIQSELPPRWREIESAILGQRRGHRFWIVMIQTIGKAVQRVGDFESIVGELSQVSIHRREV